MADTQAIALGQVGYSLRVRPRGSPLRAIECGPAAFSVVMATGILAVAAQGFDLPGPSGLLLILAVAADVVLAVIQAPSLTYQLCSRELDPSVAFGSLTFVAGTAVIGARVAGPGNGRYAAGLAIWAISLVAWLGLVRAPAALLATRRGVEPGDVKGEWCLAAVAPFSLAVLAGSLAALRASQLLVLAALALWIVGILAYVLAVSALAVRLVRRSLRLADFTPDWWIAMGGLAIATVATLSLSRGAAASGLLAGAVEELVALAHTTWWGATVLALPLTWFSALRLVRLRPRQDLPRVWAAIFPVGMYAVASHRLSLELDGGTLDVVGRASFWIAVIGLLAAVAATLTQVRGSATRSAPGPGRG